MTQAMEAACSDSAILVLGSRVKPSYTLDLGEVPEVYRDLLSNYRGPWPGRVLAERCAKAAQVAKDNELMIVVSGKGEAQAMAWWLATHGVDPARILLEYEATSTNENLENAHALLPEVRRWIVVTSGFHAPRTRAWAWHLGISIHVVTALTPSPYRQRAFAREIFALPHSLSRILWRRYRAR